MRRAALRSALSVHAERGSVAVVDAGAFEGPSTRQAAELLASWDSPLPTLVVLDERETAAAKSFRNLAGVSVLSAPEAGVADVIAAASLIVSESALALLTTRAVGSRDEGGS